MHRGRGVSVIVSLVLAWSTAAYSIQTQNKALYTQTVHQFLVQKDLSLSNQGVTLFEQTLMGLTFLALGDRGRAESQLNQALLLEKEGHLSGPKLWLALFAIHFDQLTGQSTHTKKIEEICEWFCALPQYQGLPSMSEKFEGGAIPWFRIVSLEDAQLGLIVLEKGASVTPNKNKAQLFKTRATSLKKSLEKWSSYPENSFLLCGIASDEEMSLPLKESLKSYQMQTNVFLLSHHYYEGIQTADSPSSFLQLYWKHLQQQNSNAQARATQYKRMRGLIQSLESFLDWKYENNLKVYDRSHLAFLNKKEDWYLPERAKMKFRGQGIADVCFDFFLETWNPLGEDLPKMALNRQKTEKESKGPQELAQKAKLHMLAGETDLAQKWAMTCVDQYGRSSDAPSAEAVATSWLILGKIYHDQSESASNQFKFTMADHYKEKRDQAFQEVERSYPTASVIDSRGPFKRVLQVIKEIYN